ncbi:MAG: glycosyltransferase family 4 protein [Myxococcota bacterium]
MRIAIVTEVFLPKVDGITNRLANTVRCLVEQGHEVLLIAPETAVERHAGARVVRVPGVPFPPYPGLQIAAPDPRIAWELWQFDPQVVHVVGPACLGLWGMAAARGLGLPVVASYHTDLPAYMPEFGLGWAQPAIWPMIRRVHNAAHLNLCPSRHTRDELREHGVENVGLWRGGVDTDLFSPSRRSIHMRMKMTGGRPDGPVGLYVGRISPEKNLARLGEALDAVPDLRLALVGDGPGRAQLERTLPADRVTFMGFMGGEELARAFASADVFMMPSTTETLGFVVLEAMSSGAPVVAARAGGIPDLVQDGHNGLLYEPWEKGALGHAVGELLRRDAMRRHLSIQGRKFAEAGSWSEETRQLVFDYRKAIIIANRGGRLKKLLRVLVG